MRTENQEFALELRAAKSIEAAKDMFSKRIQRIGFNNFAYGVATFYPEEGVRDYFSMSTFNTQFKEVYIKDQLFKKDFLVDYCINFGDPIFRADMYKNLENGTIPNSYSKTAFIARDFSSENGVTVPIKVCGPSFAGLSLVASKEMSDKECFKLFDRFREDLLELVDIFHSGFKVNELAAKHYKLTRCQTEALKWASRGYKGSVIAEKMGIADSTAQKHVSAAIRRMHSANVTQAVATAVSFKLI